MAKINILSPFVADLIAAGEVVERPASAVKELMENSLDAGAKNITVEIRSGGAEYIRVTDDGCGMAPEDAGVAFLRHATSKLRDEKGLESIGTLGFRGEALAAIGSVSHIALTTRETGAKTGTRLLLDGGEIAEMTECGCPEGTTIVVRGLFYNTPARLKFLKSDRAEAAACIAAALRCALGRPEVSVRCIRDDKEEFFTPGDGRAESAIYSLLGREAAADMLPTATDDGAAAVSGFVSSPSAARGNRAGQYFFCNGRPIKSQLLQAAVEQAYRNTLLTGRFPSCVIYLTLGYGSVDVNVHPAKTEVKFSDEKRVFDAVYYAALGALETPGKPEPEPVPVSSAKFIGRVPDFPRAGGAASPEHPGQLRQPPVVYQTRMNFPESTPPRAPGAAAAQFSPAAATEVHPETAPLPEEPVRVIGEALGLYILAEKGGALILIDKHAAHERMIFDRLRRQEARIMSQTLLVPAVINTAPEDAELITKNGGLLAEMGFELEPYGESAFILRAAPENLDPGDAQAALEEIVESLRRSLRPGPGDVRDEILKTVSCKAAIKAGYRSEPEEIKKIAEAVCSGAVRYCPHGRPVAWTLTRTDLDKQFKRIV